MFFLRWIMRIIYKLLILSCRGKQSMLEVLLWFILYILWLFFVDKQIYIFLFMQYLKGVSFCWYWQFSKPINLCSVRSVLVWGNLKNLMASSTPSSSRVANTTSIINKEKHKFFWKNFHTWNHITSQINCRKKHSIL